MILLFLCSIFWTLPLISFQHELGGIVCRLPKNTGYVCGVSTPHSAFYFDSDIKECIEFMFEGCGGNQNRFSTKEECMEGCRSLTQCGKGMPLMDFAGNIKRCDGERVPCPGSHECMGNGMNSVCCQKADRICQSSVHPGTLCGVPPTPRFYFDSSSKTCRPFSYTGCGGNENNFKSKGECMMFCNTEIICPRGDPHADRYSINSIASCMEDKHCPRNYTCTAKAGKKGACCPSKEFVCGTPIEIKNNCRKPEPVISWWFDYKKGECLKKEHSNCDEHFNSFANKEQCADYCIGTCPNGLETHVNPRTGQPHLCDSVKNDGCPMGYECLRSSPYASICCRTHPTCPSAESIVLLDDENVHEAKRCDPSRDTCPEQYSCQQAKNMENICCTKPLACPIGMTPLRENGGRPRVCSVGVDGNCPPDHMCVQGDGSEGSARHLCCKPQKKCVVPYVDIEKKRPVRCFPGDGVCPVSTDCLPALEDSAANLTNAIDVMFFCCHTVSIFTCDDGTTPLLEEATGRPMSCHLANPYSCPLEHACSNLADGSTACCPIQTGTCLEALVSSDGSPTNCKGWDDNACPAGKCQKALDGQYYCCRDAPMILRMDSARMVPEVQGVNPRVSEYLIKGLGMKYTDVQRRRRRLRRRPEYLKLLVNKLNKF